MEPTTSTNVNAETNEQLEAYESTLAEAQQIPREQCIKINVDLRYVVGVAQTSAPLIVEHQEEMQKLEPLMGPIPKSEDIKRLALALLWAHALYEFAFKTPDSVTAIYQQALVVRDMIHAILVVLANAKVISLEELERFEKLRSGIGFTAVAESLTGGVAILNQHWDAIQGKAPITREEMNRAANTAIVLNRAARERERAVETLDAATLVRAQMFTLLVRAYDKVRRALTFTRWEPNDVEKIALTLYSGRTGSKKKDGEEGEEPSESTPATGAGSTSTPPNTPAPGTGAVVHAAAEEVPTGHMGGLPFKKDNG